MDQTSKRVNYVLIDYENVQSLALQCLDKELFHVLLFVGPQQGKLDTALVKMLLRLGGERATIITVASQGANALDFHIAFYIGELAVKTPDAYFHIISKDTGFDPLIKHLLERKITVSRVKAIEEIPISKGQNGKAPAKVLPNKSVKVLPDKFKLVSEFIQQKSLSKPTRVNKLVNLLKSHFRKVIPANEAEALVKKLANKGLIEIQQTKVIYPAATAVAKKGLGGTASG